VPPHHFGTAFAPYPPDDGDGSDSGKESAGQPSIPSVFEVPPYAAPVCLCLRFLPENGGTHFSVQVLDLATGCVLDELPPQRLDELPAVLGHTLRWVV
jgi:hypothetical protein